MFIGHYAVGFAAKKLNRTPSLGTYFLAVQFLDLLWPTLLLTGTEKVEIVSGKTEGPPLHFIYYPWSHSLVMAMAWSLLFFIIYRLTKKNGIAALIVGLCVLSHWLLDLFVHLPDLPLYPGASEFYGFELWKYKDAELVIELVLFLFGVILYLRTMKAKNKTGVFAFWALVIFLLTIHLLNTFGSAPPSVNAIAWAGQLQWIIVFWGYWVDVNMINRIT